MDVDENKFFRKATMKICSSLELEIAMWRCILFLKDYMPADEMYLHLYDFGLRAMRTIAGATLHEGRKMDTITPFPKDIGEGMQKGFQSVYLINRPETEPGFQFMLNRYKRRDTSALVRLLEVEGRKMGALALLAEGRDRFSEAHARLFSLINDPFAIALSNTLKHQEILRLKDLLAEDNLYLRRELLHRSGDEIIGADFGLKSVMMMVGQVAPLLSPVLLLGETGVGKDVIAGVIHHSSPRKDGPFVKVNCGAIPESLLDSELFGHEKGAFTGAVARKKGRFERAHHGTLFLDEIGELPAQAQVRMLRVLQNKEIERVGGSETIPVDIRLIAATNRNLEEMVIRKEFREDLWFRLNVFPIYIPPLRARKDDIPAMVHHLVTRKSSELKIQTPPPLAPGAIDRLTAYPWPGNVRELENVIERALILSNNSPLTFDGLISQEKGEDKATPPSPSDESLILDEVVAHHIRRVLKMTKGKIHGKGGAADLLGVNASTLRNRMNHLGIEYRKRRQKP